MLEDSKAKPADLKEFVNNTPGPATLHITTRDGSTIEVEMLPSSRALIRSLGDISTATCKTYPYEPGPRRLEDHA